MGYTSSAVTVTEPTQFVSKAYSDASDATKLSLTGGTMTGHINIVGQPELSTHAVSRAYVDQVETSLVKKSGSTMTGSLILHAAPTTDLEASTKKYVDDRITAIPVPTTATELVDSGSSDGNIYRVKVVNNQVEFYRNDTDPYLNLFGSTTGLIFDTPK